MRKIHLHGHLKKFGEIFKMDVLTAGEAIRAISMQIPEFCEALKEGSYYVIRGDRKTGYGLNVEHINELRLGTGDLHIVPAIAGRKNGGGVLKAILGVALVGAAIFFSAGAAAGLAAPIFGTVGPTWGNLAMLGASIALTGVSAMLTPTDTKTEEKSDESFSISGPSSSMAQGSVIPLVYGEVITGGHVVSAGMDIENIGRYKP
ncbi:MULTISPECIES: tail assembly protein [unclassified Pseudovibrio]|uniref:tail assembly protein n=1 Tax=unclassified Pseudovibrio TaxID=2627060 RepID=UPI0007AED72C|nr:MULTISPECIES: tail assembly protein [unclassified Pseudovibrio]KZK92569.1 Bacteriophage lambda tail assembly protein I [Pseudovibrio sp. W74]KZL10387.1 Bacteriophage lambda tail assembly protein I [Pseudovibrio sp. Ad14]